MNWDFSPPPESNLSDHDVFRESELLKNKKVALLVCGGIAAMKAPLLSRELRRHGAEVFVYASKEALRYTTEDSLEWSSNRSIISALTARSEHLNSNDVFDLFLIAPATYNTINKIAQGIADNLITTTMAAALGNLEKEKTKILIAPTMHGDMHNSILVENMKRLHKMGVEFIKPRQEFGKNNLPNIQEITARSIRSLSGSSLKGKRILVTGGSTPVEIDGIRRITNIFTGKLGLEVAKALYFKGANVDYLLSGSRIQVPGFINTIKTKSYDEYKDQCTKLNKENSYEAAIYSAAVADYGPVEVQKGKIKSQSKNLTIELKPTEKIIDLMYDLYPKTKLISFKYEEYMEHTDLIDIARSRVKKGHLAVIANRGEEKGPQGEQVAHLVTEMGVEATSTSKPAIAEMICSLLESRL